MTYERTLPQTKSALLELIDSADHKVFALTGKWGTGKTHLWRQIEKERWPIGSAGKAPIGASLFGVRTIRELQFRLLKQVSAKDRAGVQKIISNAYEIGKGLLKRFSGVSAEDLVLTWLPDMLKGRLIVIDDVERKNPSLGIDEILGFIDEYTQTHEVRVLLLLNDNRLGDSAELWAKLREKVIDAEIMLNTSPDEAFEIALDKRDGKAGHLHAAAAALRVLAITNIRIIKRVLNVLDRVHAASGHAMDAAYERWVPSTVLMTAAHYRAVEDPPPLDYLRGNQTWARVLRGKREGSTPQHDRWDKLLSSLQIRSADRFEEILERFLETGILDKQGLSDLFEGYRASQNDAGAYQRRSKFLENFYWAPGISNETLLREGQSLLPDAPTMAPPHITEVINVIDKLGDPQLANKFLSTWMSAADTSPVYQKLSSRPSERDLELHPEVKTKLDSLYDQQNPPLSLLDAVVHMISESSWGRQHQVPLENSTAADYEVVIRALTGDRLAAVITEHLKWVTRRAGDPLFGVAANKFIQAAQNICKEIPESRIAMILRRSFSDHNLADRLRAGPLESISLSDRPVG